MPRSEGVPALENTWQWNPAELLLRDYYANSLLTFTEVKQRGWPERTAASGERREAQSVPATLRVS